MLGADLDVLRRRAGLAHRRLLLLPVHGGEERGDVAGEEFGFLGWGEVAAGGHYGPVADVIQAFGPFPGRLAFGYEHVGEDRHGGRHPGEVAGAELRLALPAAVV